MKTEIKRIISNSSLLIILQICNYAVPLIVYPYLIAVLGVAKFGSWALLLSVFNYLNIVVDYGFNLSATRKVTLNQSNPKNLSNIYSNVLYSKLLIFFSIAILCTASSSLLINFFEMPSEFFIMLLYLLGLTLIPVWLFQGLEKLKIVTILILLARISAAVLTILFVKNDSDFDLLALVNSVPMICAAILSLCLVWKSGIRLKLPVYEDIKREFKDGADLFISSVSVTLYTSINPILLGVFSDAKAVAYYSICERIIVTFKSIINPIYQAIYPFMSRRNSKILDFKTTRLLIGMSGALGLVVLLVIFWSKTFLLDYFFGESYDNTLLNTLLILSFIPILSFINNSIYIQTLVPRGMSSYLRKVTLAAGVFNLVLVSTISTNFGSIGSALAYTLSEALVLIAGCYALKKVELAAKRKEEYVG